MRERYRQQDAAGDSSGVKIEFNNVPPGVKIDSSGSGFTVNKSRAMPQGDEVGNL